MVGAISLNNRIENSQRPTHEPLTATYANATNANVTEISNRAGASSSVETPNVQQTYDVAECSFFSGVSFYQSIYPIFPSSSLLRKIRGTMVR